MEEISEKELQEAIVASLPSLWRFAISLSGSADLADDLSQRTCLRALERRHQVYDVTGVKRWLMTICRSIWYNDLRASALRQTQSLDTTAGLDIAADILPTETNIYAREVFTSVMTLPEAQRNVVLLVLIEGYSYREAAEILDIPIGTIMSRLSTARRKLGSVLSDSSDAAQQKGNR
jgi:RNA polymerase sigma-70 factor (ECF subfamily)